MFVFVCVRTHLVNTQELIMHRPTTVNRCMRTGFSTHRLFRCSDIVPSRCSHLSLGCQVKLFLRVQLNQFNSVHNSCSPGWKQLQKLSQTGRSWTLTHTCLLQSTEMKRDLQKCPNRIPSHCRLPWLMSDEPIVSHNIQKNKAQFDLLSIFLWGLFGHLSRASPACM